MPEPYNREGERPKRIQLRRTKGWRKPEGAIVVARPSPWGNPFTITNAQEYWPSPATETDEKARAFVVDVFRWWLIDGPGGPWWFDAGRDRHTWMRDHLEDLRGHDLACWCPLDQPCHADVLLEVVNAR
ncbi:MAG TPA: DUF4326 domain-containing protein [Acidimicrobiales bacterium]|nr:DUF4326 domain-containing protein [Acidimicrobiales bacterium]